MLVFWMELSWAIKKRLFIVYLAIPCFFYLIFAIVQSSMGIPFSFYFLPSAIALAFLFTSFLIAFGFIQKGRSFWNLLKLSGSPPFYVFLGELFFSSLVAVIQAVLFFLLICVFSGISGFGNFTLFLLFSFLFSLFYTILFLLLSLPFKFKTLEFLCFASGFLLVSLALSNVFFPIDSLPSFTLFLALLNPLTYGVEGFNWILGIKSPQFFSHPSVFLGIYLGLPILFLYILSKRGT